MSHYRKITLTVNTETAQIVDPSEGVKLQKQYLPKLFYGEKVVLCISFVDSNLNAYALNNDDLFEFALDKDFIHEVDGVSDPLMAYSDNTKVDIAGDWDSIDRSQGKVSVRVDCLTTGFLEKLDTDSESAVYMEVKRYIAGSSSPSVILQNRAFARNIVKDEEGVPSSANPEYYTAAQADAKFQDQGEKGAIDGYASLDTTGKIPTSQIPAFAIGEVYAVSDEASQLALTAQTGDTAIRSDLNKSYVNNGGTAGTMADWSELLTPTDTVLSVAGKTGAVTLEASDITDFTTASRATHSNITTLDAIPDHTPATTGQVIKKLAGGGLAFESLSSADVGLGNVENLKTNLLATIAPTAGADSTQGYAVGSLWVDTTNDKAYQCVDATATNAVWIDITSSMPASASQGDIIYHNGSNWIKLSAGTAGQFLKTAGAGADPSWGTPAGGGDTLAPSTNTDNYLPQWDGADSKTLKNGKVAPAGDVVGTSDTQTLANKTLTDVDTLNYASATELTIATGAVTITQSLHKIAGESASSDDLDTISGGVEGDSIVIYPSSASQDITLKHGTGNIITPDGEDYIIPDNGIVMLLHDGSNWRMTATSSAGGGGVSDTAWTGSNWTATDSAISQNRIQEALKDMCVRYEDRASQFTSTDNGKLVQAFSASVFDSDFSETLTNNNAGWANHNMRMTIPASEFSSSGNRLKITLEASGTETLGIALAYVGHAATTGAKNSTFDGNQVKLTFGGNDDVDIGAGETVTSDNITFSGFDNTKDLIVSYDIKNDSSKDGIKALLNSSTATYNYWSSPGAGTTDRSGSTSSTYHNMGINKIEIGSSTATTDYRLRLANEENIQTLGEEASAKELKLTDYPHQTLTATGNITITLDGVAADVSRVISVLITASGAARTLTFPAGWMWDSKPASDQFTITSGATAQLTVRSYDTDTVVAEIIELET